MKERYRYFRNLRSGNLIYLADIAGLLASGLCFIHCWVFPLVLFFLPAAISRNHWMHPVLSSMALLSTVPYLLKKTSPMQSGTKIALASGNGMMLFILFAHDHLSHTGEILLSTIGGLSLMYVHYNNLKKKKINS